MKARLREGEKGRRGERKKGARSEEGAGMGEWENGQIVENISPSPLLPSSPSCSSPLPPFSPSSLPLTVAGVHVDNLTEDETVAAIDQLMARGGPRYMLVVNAAKVVAAGRDDRLRRALAEADLVTADGMSIVWASKLLGRPLKQRVTGIDMFERLVAHAAALGLSVYFLGARDESVRGVVERFTSKHPGLRVAGYRNGYFAQSEAEAVAEAVRSSGADLLFVAMGSPAQEIWIRSHIGLTGVRFAMGAGGSFDHLSGLVGRAPRWMQRAGLEWLDRLMREPRRLWRRYLIGNTLFTWLVVKQLIEGKSENMVEPPRR